MEQSRGDYELSKESLDAAKTSLANVRRQSEIASANAEIALSSALLDVEIASGSLATVTFQESEKYANLRNRLIFETGQLISLMERHLFDVDVLLGVTETNRHLNDSYEAYLSAKNSSLKNRADTEFVETNRTFLEFYSKWKAFRQGGIESDIQLESLSQDLRTSASFMNRSISAVVEVLKATMPSQYFSQSSIDSTLASFESALSSMKSETASYAITAQSLSEAKTSMDAKVLAAQNALGVARKKVSLAELAFQKTQAEGENSMELAEQKVSQAEIAMGTSEAKMRATVSKESSDLDISKIELESRTSVDPMELEPLRIAVTSAEKALDEAKKRREDAFLRSPVDGKIVRLAGAEGGSS
jgi:multidrug resistance efflux pump